MSPDLKIDSRHVRKQRWLLWIPACCLFTFLLWGASSHWYANVLDRIFGNSWILYLKIFWLFWWQILYQACGPEIRASCQREGPCSTTQDNSSYFCWISHWQSLKSIKGGPRFFANSASITRAHYTLVFSTLSVLTLRVGDIIQDFFPTS